MNYGYKLDGDTVTLTMTVDDYQNLLISLGVATMTDRTRFYRHIALVNRLNTGNPDFVPYEIPERKHA